MCAGPGILLLGLGPDMVATRLAAAPPPYSVHFVNPTQSDQSVEDVSKVSESASSSLKAIGMRAKELSQQVWGCCALRL